MNPGLPWQVSGVRSQARETAREAARRAGMSIGEWLDSIISESAQAYEGAGRVPGHNHPDSDERSPGHGSAQREDAPEQAFAPGNPADARSGPVLQPASALEQALVEIADRQRAL